MTSRCDAFGYPVNGQIGKPGSVIENGQLEPVHMMVRRFRVQESGIESRRPFHRFYSAVNHCADQGTTMSQEQP